MAPDVAPESELLALDPALGVLIVNIWPVERVAVVAGVDDQDVAFADVGHALIISGV